MKSTVNKRIAYTLLSAFFIIFFTILAIQYAKGGFRVTQDGFVQGTGLLAANSFPTGAQVKIDGKLVTATDDTLYLEPGKYDIEISKEGYNPWKKTIQIQKELVVQTNANLFPTAPSLTTLTFNGVQNLSPSPDGQKLLFYSNNNVTESKNGLYILEMSNNPLSFQNSAKQISNEIEGIDLSKAKFIWSPDSSQVMIITDNNEFIINVNTLNDLATINDITLTKKQTLIEWEKEMSQREIQNFSKFPKEILEIATQSAKNVYLSPDQKRLLYTATIDLTLPTNLVTALPSSTSQPEDRNLKAGQIYVYDREEDKNFFVGTDTNIASKSATHKSLVSEQLITDLSDLGATSGTNSTATQSAVKLQATESAKTADMFNAYHSSIFTHKIQWFPDSKHFIFVEDNSIKIMEYDGANKTTIYSGPFANEFVYPWPNGDKLVILTSFSPDNPANLYSVALKN